MANCFAACSGRQDSLSKHDLDTITDTLSVCLNDHGGRKLFHEFLESKKFKEECYAVTFWLKSAEFLELFDGKVSPTSTMKNKEKEVQEKYEELCELVEEFYFEKREYEDLYDGKEGNPQKKIEMVQNLRENIVFKVLEPKYQLFRKHLLERYNYL